jgi:hypothetical protein
MLKNTIVSEEIKLKSAAVFLRLKSKSFQSKKVEIVGKNRKRSHISVYFRNRCFNNRRRRNFIFSGSSDQVFIALCRNFGVKR